MGDSSVYVRDSLRRLDLTVGYMWLARVRTYNFWTGAYAAKAGMIEKTYTKRCPFCKGTGGETIEHFFLRCNAEGLNKARKRFLRQWVLTIKQAIHASRMGPYHNFTSTERARLSLNDMDSSVLCCLLGGGGEFLSKQLGPDGFHSLGIPYAAYAEVEQGVTTTQQRLQLHLFRDVAGFLTAVIPARIKEMIRISMPAFGQRPNG
jgi:hypothetical protein